MTGEKRNKDGVDFGDLKTVPFRDIPRKVSIDLFARPVGADVSVTELYSSLPAVLAAYDLRDLQSRILKARDEGRSVVVMLGAHVVKCGLSPVLIDLIDRGIVTAIAMNGAGAVHDFEIAFFGETSEEVEGGLPEGSFGMSEETGSMMNRVIRDAADSWTGMGEAIGSYIISEKPRFRGYSVLASAVEKDIPVTVHVAIGTDVIHPHPSCDGGAVGATTHEDFRRFCGVVSGLEGGVILNLGSAVILPEIFLKAISVARNLGHDVSDFTAADFDMIRHYRPMKNVVERPTSGGGKGFSFTGHHEIMVPLLAAGLVAGLLDKRNESG